MRLIDADALIDRMYHDAFETDTDMQKWDSGCWIRYKMFENAIDDAPTIEPKAKVIAQVTFDEEKMREIVKETVERFKEEYDIEPKRGEWIPCNERLPDKSGEYLAYSIIGLVPDHIGDPNIRQDTTVAYYSRTFNEWIGNGVEKVLAWMPLPEPWKGADEDEKVWKIGEVIVGGEREGE